MSLFLQIGTTLLAWMIGSTLLEKIPKRTAKIAERDIENTTKTIEWLVIRRIQMMLPQDAKTIAITDREISRQRRLQMALYNEMKELQV